MAEDASPDWDRDQLERFVRPDRARLVPDEIRRLLDDGETERARSLLEQLQSRNWSPGPDTFEALVSVWLDADRPDDAATIIQMASSRGVALSVAVLERAVVAWAAADRAGRAQWLFDEIRRVGRSVGPEVHEALMAAWARRGEPSRVRHLAEALETSGYRQGPRHRRALLEALAKAGDRQAARQLLDGMWEAGDDPGRAEYGVILAACARAGDSEFAEQMSSHMEERGVEPDDAMLEALIETYGRAIQPDAAEDVFDRVRNQGPPTPGQWRAFMLALARSGRIERLEAALTEMYDTGTTPEAPHYRLVLNAARRRHDPQLTERVLRHAAQTRVPLDRHGCVLAAETFAAARRPEAIREIIAAMWAWGPRPTTKIYRILLRTELAASGSRGAEAILEEIHEAGLTPSPTDIGRVADELELEGRADAADELRARWEQHSDGSAQG